MLGSPVPAAALDLPTAHVALKPDLLHLLHLGPCAHLQVLRTITGQREEDGQTISEEVGVLEGVTAGAKVTTMAFRVLDEAGRPAAPGARGGQEQSRVRASCMMLPWGTHTTGALDL